MERDPSGKNKKSLLSRGFALIDGISSIAGMISGSMAVCCAFIVAYGAVSRYILNHPTVWEMRLTIYMLIGFGFLSAGFGLKEGSHVRVDILLNLLSERTRVVFDAIANLFVVLFGFIYSFYGIKLFSRSFLIGEVDHVIATMPVWPAKAAMSIGMIILLIQAIKLFVEDCQLIHQKKFQKSVGWRDRPFVLVLIFFCLVAIGLATLKVYPALGLMVLLVTLLFSGIPVAFGLGLIGMAGFYITLGHKMLIMIPNIGYASLNTFVLIALPLFILAGQIIQQSGMSEKIFKVCTAFIGHIRGGVGAATILSCGIFAAISGSSVANAATMGTIAIPQLLKLGYKKRLAYGLVAAGGTLGILIPPSSGMILFGVVTDESIGKLFMAGLIPGIMLMCLFMLWVVFLERRDKKGREFRKEGNRASWKERISTLRAGWAALLLPIIMLGGMYSGIFTATEAAAIAVLYALVITIASREIKIVDWPVIIRDCTRNISMILMIFIGAMILGSFVTMAQVPQKLTGAIVAADLANWQFLVILMVFLLIMGMFMEAGAVTLVIVPVLYPVILALNINIMWFAVFFVINMELACITPPVGLNLYIIQRVSEANFKDVAKGIALFVPILFLMLLIVWLFPQLSIWLPSSMN